MSAFDRAQRAHSWDQEDAPTTPSYGRCGSQQRTPGCLRDRQQIFLQRNLVFRELSFKRGRADLWARPLFQGDPVYILPQSD